MIDPFFTASSIPPFLFRTASDKSRGINTLEEIHPLQGYQAKYHFDLQHLEKDFSKARHMVRNHVQFHYQVPSEFSSWTVSLLYVLVYAVRKAFSELETNVLIYVMDTSKLAAFRIFKAHDLLKRYRLLCWTELMNNAQGEYLVHGRLKNVGHLWEVVSLNTLIAAGLFNALPALRNPEYRHLLPGRVRALREDYFTSASNIGPLHLEICANLAECFGESWEGMMTVAFVALKNRKLATKSLMRLLQRVACMQLPHLPWSTDPGLGIVDLEIVEARQFYQLLRFLNEQFYNLLRLPIAR